MGVRQLTVFMLGAVQTQVTECSLNAKGSDPRMEVKNGFSQDCWKFCHCFALRSPRGRK